MTGRSADDIRPRPTRPLARTAYLANAVLAWLGVGLTLVISAAGGYEPTPVTGNLYGVHPEGVAGVVSRVSDTLSYFTIWSNVVVAIALTLLVRQPDRDTPLRRVLRLDSVLMITITAIVYAVLLAPSAVVVGWSRLTDPILHQVTPALTVLVFLVFGPRRWVTGRVVLASMAIPLAWIVWMLARGAVVGAYPYDFADVGTRGYPAVAATLAGILVFGVVVAAVFWGLDAVITRVTRTAGGPQPEGTST